MLLSGKNPFPGRNKIEIQQCIVNKSADLNKPAFKHVSDNAKDFIKCCLIKDISKRYSAAKLLNHAWLVNLSDQIDEKADDSTKLHVLENL